MKKTITLILTSLLFHVSFAQDYYWVGGSGDVSDYANHWVTASGGSTFHTSGPDQSKNLIFDENSFSSSGQTVSFSGTLHCKDFLTKDVTNSPTFDTNSSAIYTYGSYSLSTSATYIFSHTIFFSDNAETVDVGGDILEGSSLGSWRFWGDGSWEIVSDVNFESSFMQVGATGTLIIGTGVDFSATNTRVTLKSGGSITNNGTLTFDSGAFFDNESGSSITGNGLTFKRNTTFGEGEGKYSIVGSPVSSASTSTLGNIVYKYDESQDYIGNEGLDRFVGVVSPETMSPGKGYFSANTGTITVSGMPNTGTIDVPLEYSTSAGTEGDYDGFNLVSNPYPTTMSVHEFLNVNGTNGTGAISDEIYLWVDGGSNSGRRDNGDYMTVNAIGYVGGSVSRTGDYNNNLGSFQGFFVKATGVGQTLSFTEDMKETANGADANFFRESPEEMFTIRVAVENEELHAETLIGFLDDATSGFDPIYDAKSVLSSDDLRISTLIDNAAYSIQGRPLASDADYISLNFETKTEGLHQMIFDIEDLPLNQQVSLYDTYTSEVHDLTTSTAYEFTSKAGSFSGRFQLITGNAAVLAVDENLNSTVDYTFHNNNVKVKSAQPIESVIIYSLQGKVLYQTTFTSLETERSFGLRNYQESIIIIHATDIHGKSDVQKFLIK